ncbi:putative bacterial extracellular solute-binding protein, family 5 [Treponema primitia ZAS-2]|uniref:Putative bacterial extracellular solute-binding protein, family 5 n=1 Tax=Treponema primitia (strain ATCC BAA-887 / DSM 12427 / ZAS-2) TaxID=545694 RepID=F5YI62_TREPZ|nr:ABC transporter substrate-binding protein [Treponema primitia]AEF84304.1 putative bacterial extracellular solute-binding protein, family 5 [Treponema primitia ZAS-2]
MKKISILFLTVTLLLVMSCSGSKTTQTTGSESTRGKLSARENPLVTKQDTVVISLASDLQTLDPLLSTTIVTNEVQSNAYESLVTSDLAGNVEPLIVTSWDYDDATFTYTLHLRNDVYFHDGSKLTAKDVKYSLDVGKKTGRMTLSCNYIDTTEVIDDTTVKVKLISNYSPFLYFVGINLKILPAASAAGGTIDLTKTMIGTGPYKMVEYTPGDKAVFTIFDQYYGPKPPIKNLIFKIIPDPTTQLIALESGELNLSRDFPMNNIQSILDNPQLDIFSGESGNVYYMGINETFPAFQDIRVRQALNYAIDRDFVIEACEEGYANHANSVANKGMFGYTEDAKYYEYDPAKAKQLLADAGYANGLDIPPILTKDGKFRKAAEVILEDLKAIGITTSVNVMETSGFNQDYQKKNYALAVTSVNLGQDAHHSTMMFQSTTYLNYFNINDPQLDKWCLDAASDQDLTVRKNLYHQILTYVADQAYFVPLYYPQKVWAVTSGLQNSTYNRFVGVLAQYMSWK